MHEPSEGREFDPHSGQKVFGCYLVLEIVGARMAGGRAGQARHIRVQHALLQLLSYSLGRLLVGTVRFT